MLATAKSHHQQQQQQHQQQQHQRPVLASVPQSTKLGTTMNKFKNILKSGGGTAHGAQSNGTTTTTTTASANSSNSETSSPAVSPPLKPLKAKDTDESSKPSSINSADVNRENADQLPQIIKPDHQQQQRSASPSKDTRYQTPKKQPLLQQTLSTVSLGSLHPNKPVGGQILQRFECLTDGSHVHHLKSAKRQEKLSNMLRDLIGSGRRTNISDKPPAENGQVPTEAMQPPSLMAGFLTQLKSSNTGDTSESLLSQVTASSMGGTSFAQKYGKCHEVIGKGSYGVVRVAHKTDPKDQREQLYAVKEVKKRSQETDAEYSKRLTSEFCISSSLHHPNIIQTLDLLPDQKGQYCEVMELCSGGDLYSLVLASGKLEYQEADCFFKQIVRGVNYMHEMGVAHRDLKPENILLTSNGAVKITDFGNGECFRMAWEKDVHLSEGVCGSEPYIAPEEFLEARFDPRSVDIWAIGVIYMAMRTGRHLWRLAKADEDKFYARYLQGRKNEGGYEPIESLKRARCRNVIYSILDPVPSRRITGKQILKSEWGREIRVCEAGEKGL